MVWFFFLFLLRQAGFVLLIITEPQAKASVCLKGLTYTEWTSLTQELIPPPLLQDRQSKMLWASDERIASLGIWMVAWSPVLEWGTSGLWAWPTYNKGSELCGKAGKGTSWRRKPTFPQSSLPLSLGSGLWVLFSADIWMRRVCNTCLLEPETFEGQSTHYTSHMEANWNDFSMAVPQN